MIRSGHNVLRRLAARRSRACDRTAAARERCVLPGTLRLGPPIDPPSSVRNPPWSERWRPSSACHRVLPSCRERPRRAERHDGLQVHAAIRTQVPSRRTRKALSRARQYRAAAIRCRHGREWPWIVAWEGRKRCARLGDLNRCPWRSRRRVGRCEFPARWPRYPPVRCRASDGTSRAGRCRRGGGIPAPLHEDVEHDAALVHHAPEAVRYAVDAPPDLLARMERAGRGIGQPQVPGCLAAI